MSSSRTATLDAAQHAALDLLRSRQSFVLSGHVRPDGDCLGAQAAMARVLRALGKEVRIVNADALDLRFDYLASELRFERWEPGETLECEVAIFLDFSELDRSGGLGAALIAAGARSLVVDHHLHHGEGWWDAAWIDPTAAATGLLIHRIAGFLGVELDRTAAHGVFTSLVADTGWFKYSNTDAEVLRVAGEMVARGVDVAQVYRSLHQRQPLEHPRQIGRLLAGVRYHAGGRLAVATLERRESDTFEAEVDDALDLLRAVEVTEVVLVLREISGGGCRLSARSKGDFDVHALARRFGGGGHRRAAGATLALPLREAAEVLTAAAEELLASKMAEEAPR